MRSPIYRTGSAQPGNAWPGKNNFCCCGRCITGPRVEHGGWAMFWAPTIVVGVPLLAVGGWRCIVSPSVLNPLAVIIPAMFYSMTLTCQCLTSCTDPGIIPFGIPGNDKGDQDTIAALKAVSWGFDSVAHMKAVRIQSKGYCTKCNVHRPLGAHHCNDCGHCVFAIDHHCPVFSTCIAGRNLPHFWFAIITGVASVVVTMLSAGATLAEAFMPEDVPSLLVHVICHGVAAFETIAFIGIFVAYMVLLFCTGNVDRSRDPFGRSAWRPQRKCCGCGWYQPSLVGRVLNGAIVRPWQSAPSSRKVARVNEATRIVDGVVPNNSVYPIASSVAASSATKLSSCSTSTGVV